MEINGNIRVNFVSQGGMNLASHRFRVLKPVQLLNAYATNVEATVHPKAVADAHVNIFNKHFDQNDMLMAARHGEELGFYSVIDICDDHFDRENGQFYERMCEVVDHVTCNTENMQKRIHEKTNRQATVIPDPLSFPELKFNSYYPDKRPELLWFGHNSNLKPLLDWVEVLPDGYKVKVITNMPILHPKVDYIPWSVGRVEHEIQSADIVLIPSQKDEWAKCKSPNRLTDSLISGKYVITDSDEIYGKFKDFCGIVKDTDGLLEEINLWQTNPNLIQTCVEKGQKFIKKKYNDEVILDQWLQVFKGLGLVENFKKVKNEA